jgi:hemerythrin
MGYFSWTDELSVGSTFIDNDHRKLIGLVNQLHEAMSQGQGKEILKNVLVELIKYTKEHFRREEEHMQKIQYAERTAHKVEHDKLLNEVLDLQKKFNDGSVMLTIQVSKFLREWLVTHIMKSDQKLATAIRLRQA